MGAARFSAVRRPALPREEGRQEARFRLKGDTGLLVATFLLIAIGIAMVFSTSYPLAETSRSSDGFYLLKRQLAYAVVALLMLAVGYRLSTRVLRKGARAIFAVSVLLLIAVKLLGREVNGAQAWFSLGPVNFQPSEFAKLALVLGLAAYFAPRPAGARSWRELRGPVLMLALTAGLIAIEPDMGTAAVVFLSALVFLNICGVPFRRVVALAGVALLLAGAMVVREPYQLQRLRDWADPAGTASRGSYQTVRSLVALGSGGLFGLGYCQGREKYFYLPAATTDSILAVVGEELGLIGTWAVLGLLGWVVWRGFAISRAQPDRFAGLLASGIACLIGVQALTNIAVVTGCIPTTGVPLPFVSFGGSSLAFTALGVGILLHLSRRRERAARVGMRRAGAGTATLGLGVR